MKIVCKLWSSNLRASDFIKSIFQELLLFAMLVVFLAVAIEAEEDFQLPADWKHANNASSNKTSKILAGSSRPLKPGNNYNQQQVDLTSQGSGNSPNVQKHPAISDIDMQLLNAMEKLVGRMDKLDGRVKTLESIVYHLTNKEGKPEQGSCPENFVKIDGIRGKCYHVSSLGKSSVNIFDWKTAAAECGKMGGRLVEMLSYSDFHRISTFLAKYTNTRSNVATDFWTGGLNPGLIWLWSESGQQIGLDKRFWNDNENGSNAPGCLKLSYSIRLNTFFYKGAPCSQTQNFLCEVLDNTVARALAMFESKLNSNFSNSEEISPEENV